MNPTKNEFEQIKQELLVLQKRIELMESQARLSEMKQKNSSKLTSLDSNDYKKYKKTDSTGDTVRINFNSNVNPDVYYTDNMNRSSYYEVN